MDPKHLRLATPKENASNRVSSGPRRQYRTHCPHGHAFDEANTYVRKNGDKQCRACDRAAKRLKYVSRQVLLRR